MFIVAHCFECCYVIIYASECIEHGMSVLMLCSCISLQLQLGNTLLHCEPDTYYKDVTWQF